MIVIVLTGIVLAAIAFAALLWAIYRAVVTTGRKRFAYVVLAISTVLVVLAATYDLVGLLLSAGFTCLAAALLATIYEARWNKLLPLTQVGFGLLSIWTAVSLDL